MTSPSFLTTDIHDEGDRRLLIDGLERKVRLVCGRIAALPPAAERELDQARASMVHKLERAHVRSEVIARAEGDGRVRPVAAFRAAYGAALRACALLESRIALFEVGSDVRG